MGIKTTLVNSLVALMLLVPALPVALHLVALVIVAPIARVPGLVLTPLTVRRPI